MIDDNRLATYENRVAAALRESDDPLAITADDPAELIEIIRNARRYLALRKVGVQVPGYDFVKFDWSLDAAADRLLEGE